MAVSGPEHPRFPGHLGNGLGFFRRLGCSRWTLELYQVGGFILVQSCSYSMDCFKGKNLSRKPMVFFLMKDGVFRSDFSSFRTNPFIYTCWFIPRIVNGLVHPSYKWTTCPHLSHWNHQGELTHLRFVGWTTKYISVSQSRSWLLMILIRPYFRWPETASRFAHILQGTWIPRAKIHQNNIMKT